MLSAQRILREIRNHDETFQLFLSLAASGEEQAGWENERVAELITDDPVLQIKIARHGADESKHSRIFTALLRKRGLSTVEIPFEMSYTEQLQKAGLGPGHARLRRDDPMQDVDIIAYLVHARVTEQRSSEEIGMYSRIFRSDAEISRAIQIIANGEINHLSHSQEELLRLVERGHGELIRRSLRAAALIEIKVYRNVALQVIQRMGEILGWPAWQAALIRLSIHAKWVAERLWLWRRMAALREPERRNALGPVGAPA